MNRSRAAAPPATLTLADGDLAFATDLYQLTMAAAYWARDRGAAEGPPRATFELSVRRLPPHRNFLVFAGLEQALASLAALRFGRDQIDYLRGLPSFRAVPEEFFAELAGFRFRGDLRAMPEGTVFFPGEPVMSVEGGLIEAQIVETLLLSIVNFQVTIASKAARIRLAAGPDAQLADFGGRRAHGPQAATWVARAAYLGGFDATSNVLAGHRLGLPVMGTMAHSYVMSFADEVDAFRHYQSVFPDHAIHLVDTYDTLEGVRRALATGRPFVGVRIDSGDLAEMARRTRRTLDEGGRPDAKIYASGDLDEYQIASLRAAEVPIDAYGVGTEVATSADAPALSGIYKLVETRRAGRRIPAFKASAGKATYPGVKQVVREIEGGEMRGDRVVLAGGGEGESGGGETDAGAESGAGAGSRAGRGLLVPAMRDGEPLGGEDLAAARHRCLDQIALLPPDFRALRVAPEPYPVVVDREVEELLERAREGTAAGG